MNANITNIYNLTPMQEGMFFHSLMDKSSGAYFEQAILSLEGEINKDTMEESFNRLIDRYDVLRTVFLYKEADLPLQVVLEKRDTNIFYKDITTFHKSEQDEIINDYMIRDKDIGFNLEKDILIRLAVFKIDEYQYKTIWSFHHIIMDGWCLGIVAKDLFRIYLSLKNDTPLNLPKVYPYSDYFNWLENQNDDGLEYWRNVLLNYNHRACVPTNSSLINDEYESKKYSIKFDTNLTKTLEKIAINNRTTLNTVFQTIWGIILHKYNNTDDVVYGSVVSGRVPEVMGIEQMVGLFINTVPMRIKRRKNQKFNELIKEVHDLVLNANKFCYFPLAEIQSDTPLKRDLIQHIIAFENYPSEEVISDKCRNENTLTILDSEVLEHTNYDLEVVVFPGKELEIVFRYNGLLYDDSRFVNLEKHLKEIINQVAKDNNILLHKINILAEQETNEILNFNSRETTFPTDLTIHELFEAQVKQTPHHVAVVYDDQKLTYEELNERSNQLARLLRNKGVKPDSLVGIVADRSLEMIVGILAILKSGGAYLPIDPTNPLDRTSYMIEESGVLVLLTQDLLIEADMFPQVDVINLNDSSIYEGEKENLEIVTKPNHLAYVIYTSGSTGKPKGVMIEHRNVVQLLKHDDLPFSFNENDVWTMFHSYCFDFSVWEMYGALLFGGKLVVVPKVTAQDPKAFLQLIKEHKVTVLNQTPTAFYQFIHEEMSSNDERLPLRWVIFGGEALNPLMLREFKKKHTLTKFINMYGITETTVHVTFKALSDIEVEESISNIGKPLSTLKSYVLDENGKMLPVGISGELYVSGAGVARGYLNNQALTEERFIENPFQQGTKMYRTGDLARWLPDGSLEYLGRIDQQVKIRGHRIELGEIEKYLTEHGDIREAVVIARDNNKQSPYICAYYVPVNKVSNVELKNYLKSFLPEYMIPSRFIIMDKLPLNHNGKVDRKALPEPTILSSETNYVAPNTIIEQKLAAIWQEVLEVERAGLTDHFFDLGGHSLKAIKLVGRISKAFEIDFSLRDVFKALTLGEMANLITSSQHSIYDSIVPVSNADFYPVSSAQKRLLIIHQLEGLGTTYNIPFLLKLEGAVDVQRLEYVFHTLIERHDAFRTSFEFKEGQPVQKVHDNVKFHMPYLHLQNEEELNQFVADFVQPFNLQEAPLLRVVLAKVGIETYYLIGDMHHIISDGTSVGVLVDEFMALYAGKELEPLRIQYKDYAAWQEQLAHDGTLRNQEEYWLKQFEGEVPILNLSTDFPRPQLQSYEGDNFTLQLDKELVSKLHKGISETETTLYMMMISAYSVLLSKYTGQEDIVIGSPVAGRSHADLENLIGMFVGTLAMRSFPEGKKTFRHFIQEVKDNTLKAFENQDYPYEELIENLSIERDLSRNPLFETMLVVQNMEIRDMELEGLKVEPVSMNSKISKFDITVVLTENEEGIELEVEYATRLYKKETIARFIQHYIQILHEVTNDMDIQLADISVLSNEERKHILYDFNDTKSEYPRDKTIHALFEEQVQHRPSQVAVVKDGIKVTYQDLNEKANHLAVLLKAKGVKPDDVVGIMEERSIEMVIGMLAILKAGAAYLPIDPDYPVERIDYVLEDSAACILVTNSAFSHKVTTPVEIIDLTPVEYMDKQTVNPYSDNIPTDLAYMMYTSGSTGNPKGVMIEHRNVVRLVKNTNYVTFEEGDRLLQTGTQVFDLSTFEIWGALLNGIELYIIDKLTLLSPKGLEAMLKENQITILHLTTSLFNQMAQENPSMFDCLKFLMVGGDVLSAKRIREVQNLCNGLRILNNYGPTENGVVSLSYQISKSGEYELNIPVGRPISNSTAYIVDINDNPVPIGVVGELWVGGEGVARGYKNLESLTKEKFIPSPFKEDERLYRTGDRVKWLPDGNIEFVGRMDNQIKIRGFRIETGEIEKVVLEHFLVQEAVVLPIEHNSQKFLCAYLVVKEDTTIKDIRHYLSTKIPNYMIPSKFVLMEKMPLNNSGKIDKKNLPNPLDFFEEECIIPETEVEKDIARVWSEVLGKSLIGVEDNFFELGGDSIKAIQIISKLNSYGYSITVKDLFKQPEIKMLSQNIQKYNCEIEQDVIEGTVELTPIQKWFFESRFTEMNHWNQAVMLYRKDGFDEDVLEKVFNELIAHHDALRIVLRHHGENVGLYNRGLNGKLFDLTVLEIQDEEDYESKISDSVKEIQKSINLKEGPLVKLGLYKTNKGDHLLIVIHHLVVDGVSWRILFEDLTTVYMQVINKQQIDIPNKTHSFSTWSRRLNDYFSNSDMLEKERIYWADLITKGSVFLPVDKVIGERKVKDSTDYQFQLSKIDTSELLTNVHKAYGTEINDILLCALGKALNSWTGKQRNIVNMEGHGREGFIKDINISRTVGWFTSMYPVLLDIEDTKSLSHQIKYLKEAMRRIPNKGMGYGILKYINVQEDFSKKLEVNPLVSFNYLGQFDTDINTNLFRESLYTSGQTISLNSEKPHAVDIVGSVENEIMKFSISYNMSEFERNSIEKFGYLFKESLLNIIQHCLRKDERELTPSDVGGEDLSMEDFEAISSFYKEL